MPGLIPSKSPGRRERKPKPLPGIIREDSDDELGDEDHPWEWVYETDTTETPHTENGDSRKRKRVQESNRIIGARTAVFECKLGDTVLLKAEGSNEAWVGIICDFMEDDGEKSAYFMWFASAQEIRNKQKKRTDCLPVSNLQLFNLAVYRVLTFYCKQNELYISPSWDYNPLTTINGTAQVMSLEAFSKKYPTGKVPRKSKEFGKVFICRRGCSTRTATYTEEFVWEDIYHGAKDIETLSDRIKRETKATRRRRTTKDESPERDFAAQEDGDDAGLLRTPKKARTHDALTPSKRRSASKPLTPSHRKYVDLISRHMVLTDECAGSWSRNISNSHRWRLVFCPPATINLHHTSWPDHSYTLLQSQPVCRVEKQSSA